MTPRRTIRVIGMLLAVAVIPASVVVAWRGAGESVRLRPGVGLVTVEGLRPGDVVSVGRDGETRGESIANEHGAAVVAGLEPGPVDVRVRRDGDDVTTRSTRIGALTDTTRPAVPDLEPGLNYLPMRDGTTLSAWVTLPGPVEDGPYPTVVELSVYRIGDADGPRADDPGSAGSAGTQPATAAARALGFATVGVNLRGTGCSGGALDFLGPAAAADGHDVVEAVAAQPWAAGDRVGLVGYSFSGLAALSTAATDPPSLAAVAALSVYGDAWSMFHPGGLDNHGFPVRWLEQLDEEAEPSGPGWVRDRIADGDSVCADNQRLHDQKVDPSKDLIDAEARDDAFNQTSVTTWAPDIGVPTLITSQFHDATIGVDLAEHLDWFGRVPDLRLVLTNGTHGDGVSPQFIVRLAEFLDLFVTDRVPRSVEEVLADLPASTGDGAHGVPAGPPPASEPAAADSPEDARRRYAAGGRVEVLWGSGATVPTGSAAAARSTLHGTWPPEETRPLTWHLRSDGRLADDPGPEAPAVSIRTDDSLSARSWSPESSSLLQNTIRGFREPTPGTAAFWTSEPTATDLVLAGTGSVDLWIRTDLEDVDLQAVLLQVDPDGRESVIQFGAVRAGFRRETDRSTPILPAIDFDGGARAPLAPGTWNRVRLGLPPFAHVVPPGARLRLQVGTPGDGQVPWSFGPQPAGDGTVRIGQSGGHASALVLPVSDLEVSVPRVDCGGLRAQPCRRAGDRTNVEIGP